MRAVNAPVYLSVRFRAPTERTPMGLTWWAEGDAESPPVDRSVCVHWEQLEEDREVDLCVRKLPCAVSVYGHNRPSLAFLDVLLSCSHRPVLEYEGVRWSGDSGVPAWIRVPSDRSLSIRFRAT
jgi:hypothetical protein